MGASGFAADRLPPLCGFNLMEKFVSTDDQPRGRRYDESDFDFMAENGFRFVRLPLDYRCWTQDMDGPRRRIDESVLAEIAEAVEFGRRRGLHVCINFHRGPGYCISRPDIEPFRLFGDPQAKETFVHHWRVFAEHFAEYDNAAVSFNLLNEPGSYNKRGLTPETHREVMEAAVAAIREVTPQRLIICDGHRGGNEPSKELLDLGVVQSPRGYTPFEVTHHKATWVAQPEGGWPEPAWPIDVPGDGRDSGRWDKCALRERYYAPWRALEQKGVCIHCGEMGVYHATPAGVARMFLDDLLSLFNEFGWGWAFWQLRGAFGVLDSDRADVTYERYGGHRLDREMLELLKRHLPDS